MDHSTLVTKAKDLVDGKFSSTKQYINVSISVRLQRQKRSANFKPKEIWNYDLLIQLCHSSTKRSKS